MKAENPFDCIESAHEFLTLLAETVQETKQDVDTELQRESNARFPRRVDALRITFYTLEKLESHLTKSRRILNDLRTLRRLLVEQPVSAAATAPVTPVRVKAAPALKVFPGTSTPQPVPARAGRAAA